MSRLLPVDIERQQFKTRFRGLDADEVRQFLKLVAEEQEALVLKVNSLDTELRYTSKRVADFEEREKIMREALYTAQAAAEETRQNAIKERDLILREAEHKADRLIDESRMSAFKIEREGMDLKIIRDDFLRDLETLIARFQNLAELYRASKNDDGKVRIMGLSGEDR